MKSIRPVALVVESEPLIAEDIASILEKQGYTVGIARTGAEAMAQANRLKPDLMTTEFPWPTEATALIPSMRYKPFSIP